MNDPAEKSLARVLTLWPLIFYGMGVIVGAGIYVALGAVIARAGAFAPLSFLFAGACAALTGLCYAELAGRIPKASGAVAFVGAAFGPRGAGLTIGLATILAVSVAAAAIAHGAAGFLAHFATIPRTLSSACLVVAFTILATTGARASVGLAAFVGVIEVAGLVAVFVVGLATAPQIRPPALVPGSLGELEGALAGAFIAFFAFIGFESLANMAEDTKRAERTVPLAILGAVAVSLVLYVSVSWATTLGEMGGVDSLVSLFDGRGAGVFALVGFLSVANGVLVEILMLSRLLYGMANNGQLPRSLGVIDPHGRAPRRATIAAGAIVLTATVALPFERLLVLSNALTLGIFLAVDLALLALKARGPTPNGVFSAPRWAPAAAALLSLALLGAELLG